LGCDMIKGKTSSVSFFWKILCISIILFMWELIGRSGVFSRMIFPTITDTIVYMITHMDRLLQTTSYTLKLLLIALAISTCISISLGAISTFSTRIRLIIEAVVSILNPIPAISILPFAILWFGLGEKPILFVAVFGSVCPYILAIMNGLHTLRIIYVDVGKIYGLNGLSLVRYILIPASLPHFLTGFRAAWGVAWRSVVAAELVFGAVGGKGGLGWLIYANRFQLNAPGMLGAIFCISLIGIFMENVLLEMIERKTVKKWGMKT